MTSEADAELHLIPTNEAGSVLTICIVFYMQYIIARSLIHFNVQLVRLPYRPRQDDIDKAQSEPCCADAQCGS